MKVFVVGHAKHYASWIKDATLSFSPRNADLILFTGGEDVNPSLYGQKLGRYTYINKQRDIYEMEVFSKYKDTPKLGVCRGSQFLTVMAGGSLIQHVTNHGVFHPLITKDGDFLISSTHHQMMYPFKVDHELLGWSDKRSTVFLDGNDESVPMAVEPEVVWYPKAKSFCIQGHPEMMDWSPVHDWLNNKIVEKIS